MNDLKKDKLRNEIITCGCDPNYFIRNYVKIKHPVRGLISFDMFKYQEDLINDYVEHRFNIILKARQLGISEVTAGFITWLINFNREKNVVIMASKVETAKNLIRKVKTALSKLPKWLILADVEADNRLSVELSNGSRCVVTATSEDAGRSEAISLLVIDEAAFVQRFDELWTGLYPTVAAGGRIAVISTPNGVGNKFHQLYIDAERKINEFNYRKLMWWEHPERISDLRDDPDRPGFKTSTWFVNEIKAANMSARDVAQELECNFNASGDTVITPQSFIWLNSIALDPLERRGLDKGVYIWMPPIHNRKYMIAADVARGDGADHSAAHVIDLDAKNQVAEYYGKISVKEFADLLCELGKQYNNAILIVENALIGMACIEHIILNKYGRLYYSKKGDASSGEIIDAYWGPSSTDLVPGFTTSYKNRPLMLAKLEECIRNMSFTFHSKRMIEELNTFIWNNGRAEAAKGYNDDLVMSAAIGVWMYDNYIFPSHASDDARKSMLTAIKLDKISNNQIQGASKQPLDAKLHNISMYSNGLERMGLSRRLPHGRVENFMWVY